jgi:hypothetical protein
LHTNDDADADAEGQTEQEIREWQSVEDIVKVDDPTSSETHEDAADTLHVIGDIIRVRPYVLVCVAKRLKASQAYTNQNRRRAITTIHQRVWQRHKLK